MERKESGPLIEKGVNVARAVAASISVLASVASGVAFAGPTPEQQKQAQFVADREAQWAKESEDVNCELAKDQIATKGLTPKSVSDLKYLCPAPVAARIIKEASKKPVKKRVSKDKLHGSN